MAGRDALKWRVTTKALEYAFDCSEVHLYTLAKKEIVPKPEKGRWLAIESMRGYVRYQRALRKGDATDVDGGGYIEHGDKESDHRRRLTKAKADIAEMEAAEKAGEVVAVDHVTDVWCDITANFRARTLAIAHKAAPLVAVETDTDVCYRIIETLVHEALEELSNVEIVELPESSDAGLRRRWR